MKSILAFAAVAVATVASASTNYVEVATKTRNLYATVRAMGSDPELADHAAFRATLEAVDCAMATGEVAIAYRNVSRRCPLTARAVLGRTECLSERVKGDILAVCDYDAESKGLGLTAREAVFAVAKDGLSGNDALDAAVGRLKDAGLAAGRDAATTLLRTLVQLVYTVVRVAE